MSNKNARQTVVGRDKASRRGLIRFMLVVIMIVLLYQLVMRYVEPRILPIHHVKLQAPFERVSKKELQREILVLLKGFFSTNVAELKQKLAQTPFVDSVSIKRVWPDTLLITLTEQQFVAKWGDNAAVNSRGDVVATNVTSQQLPLFKGPEGQAKNMLEAYNKMSQILLPLGMPITEVDLNTRRAWRITLNNNVKIFLGRKDIPEHLQSLATLWPKLVKRHGEISVIDLRYENGISIRTGQF